MGIQAGYDLTPDKRHAILERDGFRCRECGSNETLEVHHIFPKQFGIDHSPQNLITLCRTCHSAKSPETQASFFRKIIIFFKKQTDRILELFGAVPDERYQNVLDFLRIPSFRSRQKEVVDHLMKNRNVLVVMPTGSGKSLCYWVPGLLKPNHTLVISPLKALMYDQTQKMMTARINATYINSSLRPDEKAKRFDMIRQGLFKFIAVAPEQFLNEYSYFTINTHHSLLQLPYSFMAVDEAHCIDKWGRRFRPAYAQLKQIRELIGKPTTVALTASASKKVQQKIIHSLGLEDCVTIVTGFYRPNIKLSVIDIGLSRKDVGKDSCIEEILDQYKHQKTVIYVNTIKGGNRLFQQLTRDGYPVELYHSRIPESEKIRIQNQFSGLYKPEISILIATSAFGMGVDIKNIRCVIHFSMPSSIEDYYQQFGRAGRDGEPSEAILLYRSGDEKLNLFMNNLANNGRPISDEELNRIRQIEKYELRTMLTYIKAKDKWKYIIDYFGERKEYNKILLFILPIVLVLICALLILARILLTYLP